MAINCATKNLIQFLISASVVIYKSDKCVAGVLVYHIRIPVKTLKKSVNCIFADIIFMICDSMAIKLY